MANLFVMPFRPALDANMKVLPGAQAWFTLQGTNVPSAPYSDVGLSTPRTNPVVANGVGRFPTTYLDEDVDYRVRIYEADAVVGVDDPIEEYDPYTSNLLGVPDLPTDVKIMTPHMFGATLATVTANTEAAWTANALAMQSYFLHPWSAENAKTYRYEWVGDWPVNDEIYATYPVNDEITRRFVAGTLRYPTKASMPGGARIDYALTISTINVDVVGKISILHEGGVAFANKPYAYGVRLFGDNNGRFDGFDVFGAAKDAVYLDPAGGDTTFLEGTAYEVTYGYSNNIGASLGEVRGWYCGTPPNQVAQNRTFTLTSHVQSGAGTSQRSTLGIGDSSDFATYDLVWSRLELGVVDYTTLAFDNAAGTITFGSSTPGAKGLQVGDKIIPQSGANAGTNFEVLSLPGGGVMNVWPKPSTEAASAITGLWTDLQPHNVREIPSATEIAVWPWVPSRMVAGMKVYAGFGFALNCEGGNTANVSANKIVGTVCGGGLYSHSLYGPRVGTLETEFAPVAIMVGHESAQSCLGTVVEQVHSEGTTYDLIKVPRGISPLHIKGGSSLWINRAMVMTSRALGSSARMPTGALTFTTFDSGGEPLFSYDTSNGIGSNSFTDTEFSNHPGHRERQFYGNSGTITLTFNQAVADLFGEHNWCKLFWASTAGAAPSGTLTIALNAEMTAKGWSIIGDSTITAPPAPCEIQFWFFTDNKEVFVRKFVSRTALAAVTDAPALTSVSATNAAAAPTQAEFNAFVAEFNKLRTDLDATRGQLNTALARLRSQKLITT
jgi:hypothetical protein